ncbi:MAG: hypothetical protein IVW36_11250 [Dehalococcoidia bacterium]|nr:hypothetical protein [Dehalococcoidia bacterium]
MARRRSQPVAAGRRDVTTASRRLEAALHGLAGRSSGVPGVAAGDLTTMDAAAFRAVVAARLAALEGDVAEVRSRISGLMFVVAGAVITQVVLRIAGG